MPTPREVFEAPDGFWAFITAASDDKFEDQHFDRKEAGNIDSNGAVTGSQVKGIVERVTICISAFSNSNKEGGLLVLGLSSRGVVREVNHLSEQQLATL